LTFEIPPRRALGGGGGTPSTGARFRATWTRQNTDYGLGLLATPPTICEDRFGTGPCGSCHYHTRPQVGVSDARPRGYVTKIAPHKALRLIVSGKLTFEERAVLRRVVLGTFTLGHKWESQDARLHVYRSKSVHKVVLQRFIPAQIRQLILYCY